MGQQSEKVSYLVFIRNLDERLLLLCGKKSRLALYRCTFNGCGLEVKKPPAEVNNKKLISCGCYARARKKIGGGTHNATNDYSGKTMGRFEILHFAGMKVYGQKRHALWRAICLECLAGGRDFQSDSRRCQSMLLSLAKTTSPVGCPEACGSYAIKPTILRRQSLTEETQVKKHSLFRFTFSEGGYDERSY
jgi:hypothetical protein